MKQFTMPFRLLCRGKICQIFALGLLLTPTLFSLQNVHAATATATSLTYQGRILKADGTPFENSNVSFLFQITDPSGQCIIYQEQVDGIQMTNSGGVFDVPIGIGSVQYLSGGGSSVLDAFNNNSAYHCGSCASSGTTYNCSATATPYNPLIADGRLLRVSFYDGSGWKTISPDNVVRSVPYAAYSQSAQKLGNNVADDFLLKTGLPTCSAGTYLTWNGSSFSCDAVSGAAGGTVTGVTSANSYLTVTNGTSTPTLTLNVGTTANTVAAGNDSRLVNALQSGAAAAGDLSGNYPNPKVAALQGTAVSTATPSAGQVLKYNGSNWAGSTLTTSDISGLASNYLTQTAFNTAVTGATCSTGQTMYWNSVSSIFACQNIAVTGFSGTLAGDVTGTQGATKVVALQNQPLAATAPTSNQILQWDAVNGQWTPGDVTGALGYTPVNKAGDSMSGSLTFVAGKGSVYTAGTGGNTVTLQGPTGAVSASYVLRWPVAQSSGVQALMNDGSGNLSWQSLSSGTVTSVNATSPLSSSGGATPTLSLAGLTGLGTANQILGMNAAATGYEYKTISGTTNQITVTHGTNSVTLSTPQNIHTGASPTFAGLTLSSLSTAGFVKNTAAGVLSGGNKADLTSDVNGTLPVANGGTGSSSFASYSTIASNSAGNLTAVSGALSGSLLSWTVTGPVWTTASFPSSTTINQLLYSSANNVVTGLSTTANAVLTTNGSGVPTWSATTGDAFTQYALLAGRSGGQTLYGGTASGNNLTLESTSNTTRGNVLLAPSGGLVGIANSTPGAKLDINTTGATLGIKTSSLGNSGPNLFYNGYSGLLSSPVVTVGTYMSSGAFSVLNVETGMSSATPGTGTSRFVVTANGTVGIGTTSPSEALEVNGNVKAASYLYTSDARLKKDIITLPDALAKVLQLRGVNFVWKSNDEKTMGFIAQEVEKIYPELVKTDPVSGYKSVQYGNIVAVLVEALKEEHQQRLHVQRDIASTQNDSSARLQQLEKENQELKARLEKIEKLLREK